MSQFNDFVEIYEYFQSRLLSNPQYELKADARKKIQKFLEQNEISDEWNYLAFQFCFKANSKSRFGVIPTNHIIGKTALKRYSQRTRQQVFMVSKFLMKFQLQDPRKKVECSLSDRYLDQVRNRNKNTPRGFVECSLFGKLLYDEVKCQDCQYNYMCRNNDI